MLKLIRVLRMIFTSFYKKKEASEEASLQQTTNTDLTNN